jgi:hypothetical protein
MFEARSTNTACISKKCRDICNLLLLRILKWVYIVLKDCKILLFVSLDKKRENKPVL